MVLTPVRPAVDLGEKTEITREDNLLGIYSIESKACAIGWELIRKYCLQLQSQWECLLVRSAYNNHALIRCR